MISRLGVVCATPLILLSLVACGDDVETVEKECPESCTDGNVCTIDRCVDGECVTEPVTAGAPCGDTNVCNGVESCSVDGECVSTAPIPVTDNDPCTSDFCDPGSGEVTHAFEATCVLWEPMSEVGAPGARTRHTGVWTGDRFIVWGGSVVGDPNVAGDGAAYDPVADTWSTISSVNAPSARHSHIAVWTGSKMIVWGGYSTQFENSGALYDPATDSWSPMSLSGAPAGRVQPSFVWTGDRLVIHGGLQNMSPFGDGAAYDPTTDSWTALPAGGPSARLAHSVVEASDGSLLYFGGTNLFDWLGDGSILSPGGAWSVMPSAGAPTLRESHTALWTGNLMIVWGGWNGADFKNDGGLFDPARGWITPTALVDAPEPRSEGAALWTGVSMFVWGGCGGDACVKYFNDGALYIPGEDGGSWGTLPAAGAPSKRREVAAALADKRAILWGGRAANGTFLGNGAKARLFP